MITKTQIAICVFLLKYSNLRVFIFAGCFLCFITVGIWLVALYFMCTKMLCFEVLQLWFPVPLLQIP